MSTEIKTTRLTLRPYRAADAARVTELIGDIDVSRWLTRVPHPYTKDDALAFFERLGSESNTFAVVLDDEVIGGIGIEDELGYWLGKPYWRNGYASEAARALVARHFRTSTEDIRSGYLPGNLASSRVLTRLGFVNEAFEEVCSASLDRVVMVQKMSLSAAAWGAVR